MARSVPPTVFLKTQMVPDDAPPIMPVVVVPVAWTEPVECTLMNFV